MSLFFFLLRGNIIRKIHFLPDLTLNYFLLNMDANDYFYHQLNCKHLGKQMSVR